MKVSHVLNTLRLNIPKPSARCVRWFVAIAVAALGVLGILSWLVFGAVWYTFSDSYDEKACYYEVLGNALGVARADFEISIRDCWHNPATSVFVFKPGESEKMLLFSSLEVVRR